MGYFLDGASWTEDTTGEPHVSTLRKGMWKFQIGVQFRCANPETSLTFLNRVQFVSRISVAIIQALPPPRPDKIEAKMAMNLFSTLV